MTIEEVLRKYEDKLLKYPRVSHVGVGEKGGKPAIMVFVSPQVDDTSLDTQEKIPESLEGYEVIVYPEINVD